MAVYRTKIMAAALKVQTAEGADAVPTLAANAVRFAGAPPTLTLSWTEDADRSSYASGAMGSVGRGTPVGAIGTIELPMELHGSGVQPTLATDVPSAALDAALRIAGLVKAYISNRLEYTEADASLEVGTLYCYMGNGLLFKLVDCVAKLRIQLTAGRPGIATFAITGTLVANPTAAAVSGLVVPTVVPPNWTGATLTSLGAWSTATATPNQLSARSATLTANEEVAERPHAGALALRSRVITDRAPELTLETEVVAITAFDPYGEAGQAKHPGDTSPRFTTTIPGAGIGHHVRLETGVVQLGWPGELDVNGLAGWRLGGKIIQKSLDGGAGAFRVVFF